MTRVSNPARSPRRGALSARAAALLFTAAGGGAALSGCGEDEAPDPQPILESPSAMAFTCYGDLRLLEGDEEPDPDHDVVRSAQPLASCQARAEGEAPPGQEDLDGESELDPAQSFGFALQSSSGSVAVVDAAENEVVDGDPLTPITSAIPMGTLPVDLATDDSRCYVASANAGSCDLSYLNVDSALEPAERPRVRRTPIVTAEGERLRAAPRAMTVGPESEEIGRACPADPEGLVYVAFPGCHLVAAVEASTGEIAGGVRFGEDGEVEITDGDVSCPDECSESAISRDEAGLFEGLAASGPPRPGALHVGEEGEELFIGAANSSRVARVGLDEDGLPTAREVDNGDNDNGDNDNGDNDNGDNDNGDNDNGESGEVAAIEIELEGDVGVLELATSPAIDMGGDDGQLGGEGAHEAQFLYAVATDRTIRVADILRDVECDTQVDPRHLEGEDELAFLSCMPVGGEDTPPRRAGARSPGIHLPGDDTPLDLAFARLDQPQDPPPDPEAMVGHFAFVTAGSGNTYVVNVDDDNYRDYVPEGEDPRQTYWTLALPHTLRDGVSDRELVPELCQEPPPETSIFGPRIADAIERSFRTDGLAPEKAHYVPSLQNRPCGVAGDAGAEPVSELSLLAGAETHRSAFPDLFRARNETWRIAWEGPIPSGDAREDIADPSIAGSLSSSEGELELRDGSARFCRMGVEPDDIAELRGCDPTADDPCGLGDECVTHPEQPDHLDRGLCLPAAEAGELEETCSGVLRSERRYAVQETHADRLELGERRAALEVSPLEGCEADAQCGELAAYQETLAAEEHPIEADEEESELADYEWVCAPDPSRGGDRDQCQIECEGDGDCRPGTVCGEDGFCVEGAIPPEECASPAERFQLRVGEGYAVVGERSGFFHDRIADDESGACVADPDGHPLEVGRIPVADVPACVDGESGEPGPNPCHLEVDQEERHQPYALEDGQCVAGEEERRTRQAPALRLENPALTLHLVDYETRGDEACIGDREGDRAPHHPGAADPQIDIPLAGGFLPMSALRDQDVAFARRIVPGPLGDLWVLDESSHEAGARGQIFRFDPGAAATAFSIETVQ